MIDHLIAMVLSFAAVFFFSSKAGDALNESRWLLTFSHLGLAALSTAAFLHFFAGASI